MNRKEFMAQLERLLWDIPDQERQDALDFYNDYFDDAGEENEAQVIGELGSPGKVASIIKTDLKGNGGNFGEFTEAGYQDERFSEQSQVPERRNILKKREQGNQERQGYQERKPRTGGNIALIIILVVLTSPIWGGFLGGAFGILGGLILGLLGIVFGIAVGGIGLLVGGVAGIATGIVKMAASPAVGLVASGAGFLMLAVGILLFMAFLWCIRKAVPKIIRGFVDLCQRIFHRGRRGDKK